jgi:hypothetical protein
MKLELSLSKNDYLYYQLYKSSKRRSTKIQRIMNTAIVSGMVFLFGLYTYFRTKGLFILIFSSIITLIIAFVYPLYLRFLYKRHFSKFIDETYKDVIGKTSLLEIIEGFIVLKENGSESEVKLEVKEIREIVEIQTNYFIATGEISSIIMPKNNETSKFVNILTGNYNIKLTKELNWKWK